MKGTAQHGAAVEQEPEARFVASLPQQMPPVQVVADDGKRSTEVYEPAASEGKGSSSHVDGMGKDLDVEVLDKEDGVVSKKEEAKVLRKMDWYLLPILTLFYLLCFLDRANIGNARISTFEQDLRLVGNQFNILLTVFYVGYAASEIPMTMLCKIVGPSKFLPLSTSAFGIFTLCTAFVHSFGGAVAPRLLLGVAEASIFPGISFLLSRCYNKDELTLRIAYFFTAAPCAGMFGSLLASAILTSPGIGTSMLVRWRQIFFIEGLISAVLGLIPGLLLVPDSIETARFLTPREKQVASRCLQEGQVAATVDGDGEKMQGAAQEKLRLRDVRDAMMLPTTILPALIYVFNNVAAQGLGFFAPTIIRTLFPGRTVVQQQLLVAPPYFCGGVASLLIAYISTRTRLRAPLLAVSSLFMLAGYVLFYASSSSGTKYAALFVAMIGIFPQAPLCPSVALANVASDSARNGAVALVLFLGNIGGIIGTWSFLPSDAPAYRTTNVVLIAMSAASFVLAMALGAYVRWENARRESGRYQLDMKGMEREEVQRLGHRHPDFRFSM